MFQNMLPFLVALCLYFFMHKPSNLILGENGFFNQCCAHTTRDGPTGKHTHTHTHPSILFPVTALFSLWTTKLSFTSLVQYLLCCDVILVYSASLRQRSIYVHAQQKVIYLFIYLFIYFKVYLFLLRETETDSESGGRAEREGDRGSQAGSVLPAQSPMWGSNPGNCEIMT